MTAPKERFQVSLDATTIDGACLVGLCEEPLGLHIEIKHVGDRRRVPQPIFLFERIATFPNSMTQFLGLASSNLCRPCPCLPMVARRVRPSVVRYWKM